MPESSIRVGTWISGTDLVYGVFFGGKAYKRIKPREIIIYSLDRSSPEEKLMKVEKEELAAIGKRIEEATGIPVQVN